jgi:hypothetical protein
MFLDARKQKKRRRDDEDEYNPDDNAGEGGTEAGW